MKLLLIALLLMLPVLAQKPMVAYHTPEGWYVMNTNGDTLVSPWPLGLSGPVMGPAFGYVAIRQMHDLNAKTMEVTWHSILMDMTGKRYLEDMDPNERFQFIIDGKYAGTNNYETGHSTLWNIATGKPVLPAKYHHIGCYYKGRVYMSAEQTDEPSTYDALDLKTGKVLHTLTNIKYLENKNDSLIAAKKDDTYTVVDMNGKEKPYAYNFEFESEEDESGYPTSPFNVEKSGKDMIVLDTTGKKLLTLEADEIIYVCRGYVGYELGGKMGVKNLAGKEIVSPARGYTVIYCYDGFFHAYGENVPAKLLRPDGTPFVTPDLDKFYFYMPLQKANCEPYKVKTTGIEYFIPY